MKKNYNEINFDYVNQILEERNHIVFRFIYDSQEFVENMSENNIYIAYYIKTDEDVCLLNKYNISIEQKYITYDDLKLFLCKKRFEQ
jgi:hypothetical protein